MKPDAVISGTSGRPRGGLKAVRPGVWRVDAELPHSDGEPGWRVSRTVNGTEDEARAALAELLGSVAEGSMPRVGRMLARLQPPLDSEGRGRSARSARTAGSWEWKDRPTR